MAAAVASAGRAPLTSVGAHVPLQVKGVVEALPAVGAEVPLDVVVTLHVAIQHALVGEGLPADVAGEEASTGSVPQRHLWSRTGFVTDTQEVGLQVADCEDTHTSPQPREEGGAHPRGHTSVLLAPGGLVVELEGRSTSCWAPESLCRAATQPLPYHLWPSPHRNSPIQ